MAARMETFNSRPVVHALSEAAMPQTDPHWLQQLCDACTDSADNAARLVLADMREAGLTPLEIAETYVPAAARILGDKWCEDEQSFAHVTIGCSRLHGLLRDLGPYWRPMAPTDIQAPSVLVAVAEDIYHTLGATVLTGMLRRHGYNVRLWLGAHPGEMKNTLENGDYEAVLISCSSGESLETVRRIVKSIKTATAKPPIVILGGTIIDDVEITAKVALDLTGADHATNDPTRAIALCGQATRTKIRSKATPAEQYRRT